MQNVCANCGTVNTEVARFCDKCGRSLQASSLGSSTEKTPASQAAAAIEKTKLRAEELKKQTKHIWSGLTLNEKIIAIGALVAFIAFFLPWGSSAGQHLSGTKVGSLSWVVYLAPLSMLVSLVLLYFTQGASGTRKALMARWQIIIGTVWASVGLIMVAVIRAIAGLVTRMLGGFGSLYGSSSYGAAVGIGLYLLFLGSLAIVVGAFRVQSESLAEPKARL